MTLLEARAVCKDFAGVHSVREVCLAVEPGEVVGLVGPNGAGKTTLANLLSGVLPPTTGAVVVDGVDLSGRPAEEFATHGVIRTFQGLRLFEGLTALDNVLIGAQLQVRPSLVAAWARTPRFRRQERGRLRAAMDALDAVGVAELAARPVTDLSHGQRRRVELARAMAAASRYLVLDEPGAGLAPDALGGLADLIGQRRDAGVGVLLVEHDAGLVERLCDRVVGMADGRVVASGAYAAVAIHPALAPHLGTGR